MYITLVQVFCSHEDIYTDVHGGLHVDAGVGATLACTRLTAPT